jgi:hypothetical protein
MKKLLKGGALALAVLLPAMAMAIVPVSQPAPVLVPVDINVGAGDQFDPHVSGDWVSYTSEVGVRYYNFATNVDAEIPPGAGVRDLLSDISGSKIVFSRVTVGVGTAVMVFDAATPTVAPVEIDAAPGTTRIGATIGGNTVAYIDFGLQANGELVISDLASSLSFRVTNDTAVDGNPQVSPDGNLVTWEHCATSLVNCDIWQAVRTGLVWSISEVAGTPSPEANPDTNGNLVVYDSQRSPGNPNVFWRAGSAAEVELELPGLEGNPSIAGHYIAFESRASLVDSADIFVYDMTSNWLYQITNTPLVNEQLNDITLLPNGSLRVVWASDEDGNDQRNIKAATFQLSHPITLALQLPTTVTVNATSPLGANATFVATATDALDPNPTVACVPASGSTFAIGTTAVSCTASNNYGDQVTAGFNVVVNGTADQIAQLIALEKSFHLRPIVSLTLEGELLIAQALVTSPRAGDPIRACPWIGIFILEVRAQTGRTITSAQAAQLIALANQIRAVLGCR